MIKEFINAYPCTFCLQCKYALECEKKETFRFCRVYGECLDNCLPECFIPIPFEERYNDQIEKGV